MPLPLPNLDTRRFADLVDDARALVPRYAPAWTDHNASDPGITLVELLAWLVEQDIYRVNRVPERHRRKFLTLADVAPAPPRAARAVLALSGAGAVGVPAGTVFSAGGVPFSSLRRVRVAETALVAVQSWDGNAYADATALWREGLGLPAWGEDPSGLAGDNPPALLLGFDRPPSTRTISLWLAFARGGDPQEPSRIDGEQAAELAGCRRLRPRATCGATTPEPAGCTCSRDGELTTAWEYLRGGAWHPLDAHDGTRGLMLDGIVRLRARYAPDLAHVGAVPQPLYWFRCRVESGTPDEPPVLTDAAINAVVVEQRVPVRQSLPLAPGAVLETPPLQVGKRMRLEIEADEHGQVTRVQRTHSRQVPKVRLLAADPTALELTLTLAGLGDGNPEQQLELAETAVADGAIAVWSYEADGPHAWQPRLDFDAAGAADRVVVLDPQAGVLAFGDGEHGRVPRDGVAVLATYDVTLGAAGNVPGTAAWSAAAPFGAIAVTARGAAAGGAAAEDLVTAAGRAAEKLWAHERLLELAAGAPTLDGLPPAEIVALPEPQRAATGLDFERLALGVPGTRIRRARAWPDLDAGAPGLRAPGTVTVVLVNAFPPARPQPSRALLDRVERYLRRRKTIGTRLVVAPPDYVEVTVSATLRAVSGADAAAVNARAVAALDGFLDPLHGGPSGLGWPFGRDVYRAEVLALLDGIDGVDAVTSLELEADGGEPDCGNVCVGPTQLVVSGTHAVEVVA